MTQVPAGWYPDPAQTHPARQRYWDGGQWTEHVHDPQPAYPPPYAPTYPAAYPAAYPAQTGQAPGYGQPVTRTRPTTPDGQPLSGWWRRVLAAILDGVFQTPLLALAMVPVVVANWGDLRTWFQDSVDAADAGTSSPPLPDLFVPWSGAGLATTLVLLLVTAAYTLGFWRWKQATPGKLVVGTRIRRRDTPGPMPWGTMLARFGFVEALSLGSQVPVLGALFGLALVLDYLWPLWDSKNQALHDKVARTNVVLARESNQGWDQGHADRSDQPAVISKSGTVPPTTAGLPPRW